MSRTLSTKLARKSRRVIPAFEALEPRRLFAVSGIPFNEFPQIGMGTNFVQNLAAGKDGNVYFSSGLANNVNSINPGGVVKVYDTSAVGGNGAGGVAAGLDGNTYFNASNNLGKINLPAGTVSDVPLTQGLNAAQRMVLGPDGNFWIDSFFNLVERVTPAGQVNDFTFTGSGGGQMVSFNGELYFTNATSIDTVSTAGTFGSTFATLNGGTVEGLSVGPDGNLWYTEQKSVSGVITNYYGYLTKTGMQKEFVSAIGPVAGIAAGQDGNVYFRAADYLVGVNTAGTVVATQNLGGGNNTDGTELIDGPDGNLWYNESFNDRIGVAYIPKLAPPGIAGQPSAQGVVAGNPVSFTATANGYPVPTVQWQISTDGTTFNNVPGATSTTYTFTAATAQNGDLFRAVFTSSQGSATTNSAKLNVFAAPVVTTQPANQSITAGNNVSFTAAASGTPAPTVQWQTSTNGVTFNNIPGATAATYTFVAAPGQNADLFRAVFTNSQNSATTNAVTLTVNYAPTITLQPMTQSIPATLNVSLIAAASGNPAPTVQWQVSTNGTTFNNVAGATSPTYTFAAAPAQDGDLFRAVFTNSQGLATTNAATLTVTAAAVAPAITAQPDDESVTGGTTATFTASASGSPSPTVQWQISTDGSTFNDIPGATSTTYAFTAALGQDGEQFRAVFTNSQGSATTNAATLAVTPVPSAPIIAIQPTDQSGNAGDNVSFMAAASGYPAPTVQWQVSTDGTTFNDIAGATSATYTFAAAPVQTGNLFRAVFTNSQGSATSDSAVLNPGIVVGTSPSPVILTLGRVTLPAVAVVGVPFNGKVPVTITNTGATSLSGNFTLNLYANANPTLDGGQTLITSLHSHFTLKPTKSHTLIATVRSLPAGLDPGAYFAVAEVIDPLGATRTTATGQPFQLNAAYVTLDIAQGDVLPATIAIGKSGSIDVTVTNTGNVVASGPFDLTLSPSTDGVSPLAGVTLAEITTKRIRIAPGKNAKFKLRFKVTAATTADTYLPYLSVTLAGVTQTAVGTGQFTIV